MKKLPIIYVMCFCLMPTLLLIQLRPFQKIIDLGLLEEFADTPPIVDVLFLGVIVFFIFYGITLAIWRYVNKDKN